MTASADFAFNFRKLRQNAGHTQESLAEELGLCTSTINKIENRKQKLTMDIIAKLPKAVNKTHEEVLKELNGTTTVNSSIKENHGNGVNIEATELKTIIELYERIIAEKDKYIAILETKNKA